MIGNNVNIRPKAIVSKGVTIEDGVFIGPGVITLHTKHVKGSHGESENLNTIIGKNAVIGAGAILLPGVTIGENVVIGAGAVVTKDCLEPGTYVGNPARRVK